MKIPVFIMAAITAVSVGVAGLAAPWTKETLMDHISATNFVLEGKCSATLISLEKKQVLTALHCVAAENMDKIKTGTHDPIELVQTIYNGSEAVSSFKTQASIIGVDTKNDLALLHIDIGSMPFGMEATVATVEPLTGSSVFVVGNPLGVLDNTVTKGILSAKHRVVNGTHYWQTDANTIGGNSGGAVYNEEGEMIGVLHAGMSANVGGFHVPLGFNLFTPLPILNNFLEKNGG